MNNDHAMAIVCDLALCIGREVTLDALLTKVLQRFMHHCATPVGAVLQQQQEGYKLLKVIGDEQLRQHTGTTLPLPGGSARRSTACCNRRSPCRAAALPLCLSAQG